MSTPAGRPDGTGAESGRQTTVPWRVALSAVIVLALIGLLALTLFLPGPSGHSSTSRSPSSSRSSQPTTPGRSGTRTVVDAVPTRLALHATPGGQVVGSLSSRTTFGSPRVVPVVRAVTGWLGVITSEVHNGQVGWIRAQGAQLQQINYSIRIETRSHRLTVFQNGRVVRTMSAGVGQTKAPTPVGQFAVTDKLRFQPQSAAYGCCALALSAHEPRLLPGWTGGDLVAIHSTPETASIGRSVSHGCVRVSLAQGHWLMNNIPLGTLVTVRDR
jgi:lipoprotein-anchoring transpeptidase ErfK/SrfK